MNLITKYSFFLCLLFINSHLPSLLAQNDTPFSDTLQVVDIIGFSEQKFASGAVFTQPDSVMSKFYSSESLGQLLQQSTGLYIKSYGSSRIATAGFRGTNAGHTRLTWNGLPINSPTLGLSDLAILPSIAFNKVQVHHGSGGALFGSGAIGGTIRLASDKATHNKPYLLFNQGFGSYSWRQSNCQVKYGKGDWQGKSSIYYSETDNNLAIQLGNLPVRYQENARVRLLGAMQDVYWTGKNSAFDSHLWYYSSDRQLPPPISRTSNQDRQWDRGWRWTANFQWDNPIGDIYIKTGWSHEVQHFKDFQLVDDITTTNLWMLESRQAFNIGRNMEGQAGIRGTLSNALGENLDNILEKRLAAFGLWRGQWQNWQLSAQIRKEWIDGFNPPAMPTLGLAWAFAKQWALKGQWSMGYRLPTLNERYWQPGGNPNILPEESNSYEAGLQWKSEGKKLGAEGQLQAFLMEVGNWIYWLPTNAGYWSPANVQKVKSQGIEFIGSVYGKKWKIGGQYTFTHARIIESINRNDEGNHLFYVPEHKGNIWLYWNIDQVWQLTANYQYTDARYDIDRSKLQPFSTLDLGIRWDINEEEWKGISWLFKVDNIFNTSYQNVINYPMPGRNWKLQLDVKIQ